jgi:hypothetical protein
MSMTDSTVLIKTKLGRSAIAERDPALPQRLRPLLITVDGKRTVRELTKVAANVGGLEALEFLEHLGMVASLGDAGHLPDLKGVDFDSTMRFDRASIAAYQASVPNLADIRSEIIWEVESLLGPHSHALIQMVTVANTLEQLQAASDQCAHALREVKGDAVAEAFVRAFDELLRPSNG